MVTFVNDVNTIHSINMSSCVPVEGRGPLHCVTPKLFGQRAEEEVWFGPSSPPQAEQCFDWSIVTLGEWGDASGLGLGVVCCPEHDTTSYMENVWN